MPDDDRRDEDEEFVEDDAQEEPEDTSEQDAAIQARAKELYDQQMAAIQQQMGEIGLGLTTDGKTSIVDPSKVKQWAAIDNGGSEKEGNEEDDEDQSSRWPDPEYDGEKFQKQLEGIIKQQLQETLAPFQESLKGIQARDSRREVEDAISRTRSAVEEHMPAIEDFLDHPDYERLYRAALEDVDTAHLSSDKDLVRIAAMVVPDLDMSKMPKKRLSRVSDEDIEAANYNRGSLARIGPSRGNGRPAKENKIGKVERDLMNMFEMSEEEAIASQDEYGREQRKVWDKQRSKSR